ncbi:conserved hypothetical protein (plasmid) [Rhizobium rhizogenes K84]|uniref:Uncharacterized protein n=1 Tax=Rhizobium rhizogenes (strain K84 / ATCC BAA-868) TaxID=311403 RepID=B9JPN5_RHIR8|nr:conserved hypothetical protein [Rhizobium rhizogenes K84]
MRNALKLRSYSMPRFVTNLQTLNQTANSSSFPGVAPEYQVLAMAEYGVNLRWR